MRATVYTWFLLISLLINVQQIPKKNYGKATSTPKNARNRMKAKAREEDVITKAYYERMICGKGRAVECSHEVGKKKERYEK